MRPDVPTNCRTRLLMALLVMIFGGAQLAFAAPEISNVKAKVEKRKNSSTGRDEAWVVITYDIDDLPQEGAILQMKADLLPGGNDTATPVTVQPLDAELKGAVGSITSDGKKTIEWQAEQSLVRLGKQGKYDCHVTLSLEGGGDISKATLNVTSYVPTAWNYFDIGQAIITNLERTSGFEPTCTPRGANWHESVEAGAVFYKGDVTRIPTWRGRRPNDNITGTYDASGCSAFLAIKGRGTPDEKIWVNFARHFDGLLSINGQTKDVDWEFQFRYTGRKKDNFKELKAGNAGDGDDNSFLLWNEGAEFSLDVESGELDEKESPEFELVVPRREYKHNHEGSHVMTFTAADDATFEEHSSKPNTLVLNNASMKVNDWLQFNGSVEFDTTPGRASFVANGTWSTPNNGALFSGPFAGKLTDGLEAAKGTGASEFPILEPKWKIGGFFVSVENVKFIGGPGSASGVQFDIRLLVKQLSSGCAFDIKKDPLLPPGSSTAGFKVNGVKLTNEGWEISGVEAQNVGIAVAPVFCLKSFKANYDRAAEKLTTELIVKGPIFDDMGGGLTLVKGEIDGFRMLMKLAGGGVPIPYPPPPAHVAEWRGFDVAVLNATNGPFTLDGKLFFANNSTWKTLPPYQGIMNIINKVPGITIDDVKLFEVDGVGKYVHDQEISGGFDVRLFSLFKDTWLMQGNMRGKVQVGPSLLNAELSGGVRLLNFGNDDWMFNGTGSKSLSILPQYGVVGKIDGQLLVPRLYKNNPVFIAINDWFKLPWNVAGATATIRDMNISVGCDLPRFGKTEIAVDLTKNPFTQPTEFMRIVNGGQLQQARLDRKNRHSLLGAGADTAWTEFVVTADIERGFVQLWGTPAPPVSVLVDPQGKIHTATAADSSVIFYASEEAGQSAMWVMKNPVTGSWKVGTVGGAVSDSIYTWGRYRDRPAFTLASQAQGRTIVATWDGAAISPSATVDIFLDKDQEGLNGALIGSVPASAGEFRYTLNDSLPECNYYIYAVRNDNGSLASAYSQTRHDNSKTWLAAPTGLQAVATPAGDVTVTWNASADPKALEYSIRVRDANGHDSVYTTVNLNFTMAQIHVEDWQNKTISIRTLGENNLTGCWSEPIAFMLSSVEENVTGRDVSTGVQMAVAPHPVSGMSTVFVNLASSTPLFIELYNIEGEKVATLKGGIFDPGTVRAELDATNLPNGLYFIRVTGENIFASRKIVVQH